MKVLGISGSPRPKGNTEIAVRTALDVLADEGLETEFFSLAGRDIKPCCACGGCGELPLVECDCDMPRGALEAKAYIRAKLEEGLSVESVIRLVDEVYGHRIV